ncbi:unnamed protein product [Symbiodinium sp. CCMP2592]|nr:unnamed protein product [Symbiodinium sp. CCMP2592]
MTKVDPRTPPAAPETYPVILKEIDCQFYVGTWVVHDVQEWQDLMTKLQKRSHEEFDRRRQFYFKWFQKLYPDAMPESRWQDLVMYHVEPYFEGREHQIEIVFDESHGEHTLIADTGDLIKHEEVLTMFVTPGSFEVPKEWTHAITKKLHELGYKNQAIDLEFIFTKDGPQLVEINSRYSYMGYWSWYTQMSQKSTLMHQPDVRNLENRTCSCLGMKVPKFPSDMNIVSKLAVAVYTNKTGKLDTIVNTAFLDKFLEDGPPQSEMSSPPSKAPLPRASFSSIGAASPKT